jgi:hypothetical protein
VAGRTSSDPALTPPARHNGKMFKLTLSPQQTEVQRYRFRQGNLAFLNCRSKENLIDDILAVSITNVSNMKQTDATIYTGFN